MPPDPQALRQAAQWFATLRDESADDGDRQRWREWLAASAAHAQAWQRVEAIHQPFSQLAGASQADGPSRAQAARSALHAARQAPRRRSLRLLGLAGVLLGSGALLRQQLPWREWAYAWAAGSAAHRTAIGEQRRLRLEDGSSMTLNTATAVDLDFSADWRRIVLRGGEVLVSSAPDPQRPPRPLVVDTPHGRLTALGTRFVVRSTDGGTDVSVFEGRVRVAPADHPGTRDLPAGQQTRFNALSIAPEQAADLGRESWARGMLVADNTRLDALVLELSRYTAVKLQVAESVAGLRVVGVYRMAQPQHDLPQVLLALEQALPVRVRRTASGSILIEAR